MHIQETPVKDETFTLVQKKQRGKSTKDIPVTVPSQLQSNTNGTAERRNGRSNFSSNGSHNATGTTGTTSSRNAVSNAVSNQFSGMRAPGPGCDANSWRSQVTPPMLVVPVHQVHQGQTAVIPGITAGVVSVAQSHPRSHGVVEHNHRLLQQLALQNKASVSVGGTSDKSSHLQSATQQAHRQINSMPTPSPAVHLSTGYTTSKRAAMSTSLNTYAACEDLNETESTTNNDRKESAKSAIQAMEIERTRRVSLELAERQKFLEEESKERLVRSKLAVHAAEEERIRRIQERNRMHVLDDMERKGRQKLATFELQKEQQARLMQQQKYVYEIQRKLTKNIRNFIKVILWL